MPRVGDGAPATAGTAQAGDSEDDDHPEARDVDPGDNNGAGDNDDPGEDDDACDNDPGDNDDDRADGDRARPRAGSDAHL